MSVFTRMSCLHSFHDDHVRKYVMGFNVDARNKYEDPSNNLFRETVERKTNRSTAFNTVAVRKFERCTYTSSLERYCARGCLVQHL